MSEPLLYDAACKGRSSCWNPFVWKTRMALNYKGIDYKTKFMEYPEIKPTLQSLGVPPNPPDANFEYTIPTMTFPDGTHVMDSAKIIQKIEALWPDKTPLLIDSPLVAQVEQVLWKLVLPLAPEIVACPLYFMNESSVQYIAETRAKIFGMSLDQMKAEKGGEQAWEGAKEGMDDMVALLKAHGGPYFLGETVSYADFHLAAHYPFFKKCGEEILERFLSFDPVLVKHYKACQPWQQRDD